MNLKSIYSENSEEPQVLPVAPFFALLNSEASLHRLCKPLPLVFEPLEYPGAIDIEMEFVVRGVSLDLYLRP